MREDDIKWNDECLPMAKAVLALNAEIERRIEEIIAIGRAIVLPYFSAQRLTFLVKANNWMINTSDTLPGYVSEVLNKDIGRTFVLGAYLGNITAEDWTT